jgi:maleylacetate reductase
LSLSGTLMHTPAGVVRFGSGVVQAELGAELEAQKLRRVFVLTSPSVASTPAYRDLVSAVGSRCVGSFDECVRNAPRATVLHVSHLLAASGAEAVIALGGGSTMETAKSGAVALTLGIQDPAQFDALPSNSLPLVVKEPLPTLIAIPVTLSGAEYSPFVSNVNTAGTKQIFRTDAAIPRLVFLDPAITAYTPRHLWDQTALKVLGDALERAAAMAVNAALEPLHTRGMSWLARGLEPGSDSSAESRLQTQVAVWMSMFASFQSPRAWGLGTALRHVVAPALGIGHAALTARALAPIYRFNALAIAPAAHESIAAALGIRPGPLPADAVVAKLWQLQAAHGGDVPLSKALDRSFDPTTVAALAATVAHDLGGMRNPRKGVTAAEVAGVLEEIL